MLVRQGAVEDAPQSLVRLVGDAQQLSPAGVQVERAHDQVAYAQRAYEGLLVPFAALLLVLLVGVVQQEALVHELAVLLYQLGAPEHVQDLAVLVMHAVFEAHAIARLLERGELLAQHLLVGIDDRVGNHVESVREQVLLGFVPENVERGLVDADDACAVERVREHAAVHGREHVLERLVLLEQVALVGALLRHVDCDAHGAHDAAVEVVQRRLVGRQKLRAAAALDDLLGNAGLARGHDLGLRLDAGRIVGLDVPDVGVSATLDVILVLADRLAEAVVDLLVNAIGGLVPDQAGNGIDGRLEELGGLEGIRTLLAAALPPLETPDELTRGHVIGPDVREAR